MEMGRPVAQGRTAEVFDYDKDDVIKLYRKEMKKEAAEYEFKVGEIIKAAGINTPRVKDLIDMDGRKGIIFEKITGATMLRLMSSKPHRLKKLAREFAQLHYSIHNCIAEELPPQKDSLKRKIKAVDMLSEEKKSVIINYLNQLEDRECICHSDFHPDNIIMSQKGPVIIDWMTCTKGSSLSDVARTILILKCGQAPEDKSCIERLSIDIFRKKLLKYYLDEYLKLSKVSLEQIDRWQLPVAAARLIEWLPPEEKQELMKVIDDKLKGLGSNVRD